MSIHFSIKEIGMIAFTAERPPDFWADRGYDLVRGAVGDQPHGWLEREPLHLRRNPHSSVALPITRRSPGLHVSTSCASELV